ncbi:MAG: AAA family ATPase [Bacteroidaceae bacterium]|nr:AAA family ATPase [Bacteroidaceae bacterium]
MPINSQMRGLILENFGFRPTKEQEIAAEMMSYFLFQRNADSIFVLRGYAGTGKTSLVGALVRSLVQLKQQVVLMAPTGRAAKVFALHAGHPAFTIHRRIYRQKSFTGEMTDFLQGVNLLRHTLFIVDEASMIANSGAGATAFGTGCLLDDLVHFVYSGEGCRLMLVGDTAQLPPVGEEESPALATQMLQGYGLQVHEMTLTEVVRQLEGSGILWNATRLRRMLADDDLYAFPQLRLAGFADIVHLPGSELIEALEQAYYQCGTDGTIVVTRSNARANVYNQGIRARILDYDSELASGDQVIVVKNNYHWLKPGSGEERSTPSPRQSSMDFIANGDIAVVRRMRGERQEHGFRFADILLSFPDYDDLEVEATAILDTLHSEAPALTRQQQESLFQHVWEDYPELTTKRERMKAVKEDPYFNALQIKYAYAVTCHKAQGGQWERVFIDQGYVTEDMLSADYFRWLYTALTRATDRVYLVNWPREEMDAESQQLLSD